MMMMMMIMMMMMMMMMMVMMMMMTVIINWLRVWRIRVQLTNNLLTAPSCSPASYYADSEQSALEIRTSFFFFSFFFFSSW